MQGSSRLTHEPPPAMASDRLSWLWLALAAVLSVIGSIKWNLPLAISLAAWLGPIFFIRFLRSQPPVRGLLAGTLVSIAVAVLTLQGVMPLPPEELYAVAVVTGLFSMLPYLADRVLARRLPSLTATLPFPLALTTFEYLNTLTSPFGTWGATAYSQAGNLPLVQLVSVTGIWGLTFVIAWCASTVNWAWERRFDWPRVRVGVGLYAGVLGVVLLFGGVRLALAPPVSEEVRVAAISPARAVSAAVDAHLSTVDLAGASVSDRAAASLVLAGQLDHLLERSRHEARAGARVVAWNEAGGLVLKEDEPALIERGRLLAREEGIYLGMGLGVVLRATEFPFFENKVVMIDPTGEVLWHYHKAIPTPGERAFYPPGDGIMPVAATPYGRLATTICFDNDFPALLRQAGQAKVDLLLAPSNDWREVAATHAQMATFRAIENGFALVRPASKGLTIATDAYGRTLASADYFQTDHQVMIASMPARGTSTIYAQVGDLFAYLCIIGLAAVIGLGIAPWRHVRLLMPRRAI